MWKLTDVCLTTLRNKKNFHGKVSHFDGNTLSSLVPAGSKAGVLSTPKGI